MADHIHIRGEGGAVLLMDLPLPESIADRLTKGLIRRVNEDGSPFTESAEDSGGSGQAPGLPLTEPAKSAPKAEWIGWAVVNGASAEVAEAMTKTDLVEKYGGLKPPSGGGEGKQSRPDGVKPPARSASAAEWATYARSVADTAEELDAIDDMTREQLVEEYGGETG